jgi:hypothetical protein
MPNRASFHFSMLGGFGVEVCPFTDQQQATTSKMAAILFMA